MFVIDLTLDEEQRNPDVISSTAALDTPLNTVIVPPILPNSTPSTKIKTKRQKPVTKRKQLKSSQKSSQKPARPVKKCPPEEYCVCGIDIGLKNFSSAILRQSTVDHVTQLPTRPQILDWRNKNLYEDRVGGKIIKYEAADGLIHRVENHLDTVGQAFEGGWIVVNEVYVESQSASTNAIKRVETIVFAYFVFKHPHIKVQTISASRKLSLAGMTHSKEETSSYKGRKNLAITYARRFMAAAPPDCPFKHLLDPTPRQPRKRKGEKRDDTDNKKLKHDDNSDCILQCLYVLGVPITLPPLT